MASFFEFTMKQLQKLKNFGTIKIDNKYVGKWLVKLNFKPTFPLEVWCILL
jgi:hypothetical protein